MALTKEVLTANESLKGLSDEQITAIETLSANDENKVIGAKIGELHGQYDQDILSVTGVAKNQGEKSYDYGKRVLGDFKARAEKAAEYETEIQKLTGKVKDYEDKFKAGQGSEALAQKLKDTESKLGKVQAQFKTEKESWERKEGQFATEMNNYKLDVEFARATSGLKFKPEYPESVQKVLLKSAKESILSVNKTDWIDDGNGGKIMVFRDEKGEILRNPEKQLNPMTAVDLVTQQLKDTLDFGKKAAGGGTGTPGGGNREVVDLNGAKTQVEADEAIETMLLQEGLTRGSQAFSDRKNKIWGENEIGKLPVR